MRSLVVLVVGTVDDPVGAVEKMLDRARARPLEGIGWILEADDVDPKRAARRARQARYRARRRNDANDATTVYANDAAEVENSSSIGGPQLPTDRRESRSVVGPKNDANDARRDDARDATRDDALELADALAELADLDPTVVEGDDDEFGLVLVDERYDDQPGSAWRLPPRTDAETEAGRARIRELKDRLRDMRGDAP